MVWHYSRRRIGDHSGNLLLDSAEGAREVTLRPAQTTPVDRDVFPQGNPFFSFPLEVAGGAKKGHIIESMEGASTRKAAPGEGLKPGEQNWEVVRAVLGDPSSLKQLLLIMEDPLQERIAAVPGPDQEKNLLELEVTALLLEATREISKEQHQSAELFAVKLLSEVENELNQSFRERVFELLRKGYLQAWSTGTTDAYHGTTTTPFLVKGEDIPLNVNTLTS